MTIYILKRLLSLIPVMFLLSILVFALLQFAPGDPAIVIVGEDATVEDIELIRAKFGLDKPILTQYAIWLKGVLQGDLGRSNVTRRPVLDEIRDHAGPTIELATASIILATAIGVAIGVISATKHNTLVDRTSMVSALFGVSTPTFWLGLMLIYLFGVRLLWLPTGGIGSFKALILPSITLAAASLAIIARMTRSSMLDVLKQDYVRAARAKGVRESNVIFRHSLKNAFIPVITVIGLQYGYLLAGAVVTETIFSRPGLGRMLLDAINSRDFPVVQGTILVLSISFVLVNLIVDVCYVYLDPRIQYT